MVDVFWAEAVNTAVYLHARTLSQALQGITPYEKLHKRKPEFGHLQRFGCRAFKLIPKELWKGKLIKRSKECIFLGYVHDTMGIWRLWDPAGRRVVQASDIVFDEPQVLGTGKSDGAEVDILSACVPKDMPPEDDSGTTLPNQLTVLHPVAKTTEGTPIVSIVQEAAEESLRNEGSHEAIMEERRSSPPSADHLVANSDDCEEASSPGSIRLAEPSQDHVTLRHSRRMLGNLKRDPFAAIASTTTGAGFTVAGPENDPISYQEVVRSHYSDKWQSAMREEF